MTQTLPPEAARKVDSWNIDPVHSAVQFVVRHAFTRLRGRFGDVWGVLSIADPPERSTGHVEIAAGSIDTGEEFLQAERFPSWCSAARSDPRLHTRLDHTAGVELGREVPATCAATTSRLADYTISAAPHRDTTA